jgi:2-iminobutanoate/2-iminopropanoate deaminase
MKKQIVTVPGASEYPLSPAIKAGDYIFVSGHVGNVDEKGEVPGEDIETQTRQSLERIKRVLEAAGASLNDVVKTTVFLVNADHFFRMNNIYKGYFTDGYPARSTIVVGLLRRKALVEIECIAYHP